MAVLVKTPREEAIQVAEYLEKIAARIHNNDSIVVVESTMDMSRGVERLAGLHPEQLKSDAVINYSTGEETWTVTARLLDLKVRNNNYQKGYPG